MLQRWDARIDCVVNPRRVFAFARGQPCSQPSPAGSNTMCTLAHVLARSPSFLSAVFSHRYPRTARTLAVLARPSVDEQTNGNRLGAVVQPFVLLRSRTLHPPLLHLSHPGWHTHRVPAPRMCASPKQFIVLFLVRAGHASREESRGDRRRIRVRRYVASQLGRSILLLLTRAAYLSSAVDYPRRTESKETPILVQLYNREVDVYPQSVRVGKGEGRTGRCTHYNNCPRILYSMCMTDHGKRE
ncbi:hypothetical protein EXIGLDRAFT_398065 [Exidia glandulosa HHB12029]|uniref:Uncharacterized protein n=1 Tax=Exidia glandulosa HHB12029 TaxID=1314781 RepID=A0A165BN24_EXIGL|nr:hypothetical protein EXIGLDRAFT_398065 [Exidia glandulosa HHB12029]